MALGEGGITFKARELVLRDLGMSAASGSATAITLIGGRVVVENCAFQRKDSSQPNSPFITVRTCDGAALLHWRSSSIDAVYTRAKESSPGHQALVTDVVNPDLRSGLEAFLKINPFQDPELLQNAATHLATAIAALPRDQREAWFTSRPTGRAGAGPAAAGTPATPPGRAADTSGNIPSISLPDTMVTPPIMGPPSDVGSNTILSADIGNASDAFYAALRPDQPNVADIVASLTNVAKAGYDTLFGEALALTTYQVGGWIRDSLISGRVCLMSDLPRELEDYWADVQKLTPGTLLPLNVGGSLIIAGNALGRIHTRISAMVCRLSCPWRSPPTSFGNWRTVSSPARSTSPATTSPPPCIRPTETQTLSARPQRSPFSPGFPVSSRAIKRPGGRRNSGAS